MRRNGPVCRPHFRPRRGAPIYEAVERGQNASANRTVFVFMVTHDRTVFHGEFRTARAVGSAIDEIADEDGIVVIEAHFVY